MSLNWNSESMNEREWNGHSFPENQDVLDQIKKVFTFIFTFRLAEQIAIHPTLQMRIQHHGKQTWSSQEFIMEDISNRFSE